MQAIYILGFMRRLSCLRQGWSTGLLRFAVIGVFFLPALSAAAQDADFTATVNKRKVSLNGTLQVTFTLENADGKNFKPPAFHDFTVLSGPNQSTSMQIINGNVSRSISYSYYLRPVKKGTLTIGAATIVAGGKTLSTNPITVEVTEADSPGEAGSGQSGKSADIYDQISDNVFLRLLVDKTEVYQGEQITVMYKLYYRWPINNTSVSKPPSYTGFWVQSLELPENIQFSSEVYNGMEYNAAVIKKDALFPQRDGELEIDPMELQTNVRLRVQSQRGFFFDDFFSTYQDYPYKFRSNTVKVKVKSLPKEGRPESFTGAVGSYTLNVTLSKTEIGPDEPVTLTISISGTGSIKLLQLPEISLPSDLDVFDPKQSEKISTKGNIVSGSKSNDYLIIPRRSGQYKIPSVEFSYFDPVKEQYFVQRSPEYLLLVEGESAAGSQPVIQGITKEEVELIGQDIRYIKTSGTLKKSGEAWLHSWKFMAFYATPFFLFVLLLMYKRREEQIAANPMLLKNRRANKEAIKRLRRARTFINVNNRKAFYDEIAKALWGYLGDKLKIEQAALSRDRIEKILTDYQLPQETINQLLKVLDDAESALFAPSAEGDMKRDYERAREIISRLETELKSVK
ncbi:MAG: hypothetical protein KatS3mg031_1287 [Chitinophagales bacterium]|nr:MAG: hypothetical protein KatS3mg031_1287 [Chitinophagales bacterium]